MTMASGQYNNHSNAWWKQPLPPGWEAKYDFSNQRYFFIDHNSQLTSWEDPRQKIWLEQQAQSGSQTPTGMLQTQGGGQPISESPGKSASPIASPTRNPNTEFGTRELSPSRTPAGVQRKSSWQKELEEKYNMRITQLSDDETDDDLDGGKSMQEPYTGEVNEDMVKKIHAMFPMADEQTVRQKVKKNRNLLGLTIMELQNEGYQKAENQAAAQTILTMHRIKRDFPTIEDDTLRDILRSMNNNEAMVKRQLLSLGYKSASNSDPLGSPRRNVSPSNHARGGGPGATHYPGKTSSPQGSRPSPTRPARPALSEQEKMRLQDHLALAYPNLPRNMIIMALDTCQYDESKAKVILRLANVEPSSSSPSRARAPEAGPSSRVTTATSSAPSSSVVTTTTNSRPSTSGSLPLSGVPKPTETTSVVPSGPSRASPLKSVTKVIDARSPTTPPKVPVGRVTVGGYVSCNRCAPQGPDTSIVKGPSKTNLIPRYIIGSGPNPSFRRGPESYQGPDNQLARGPDRSLHCGPNASLPKGSIYRRLGCYVTDL